MNWRISEKYVLWAVFMTAVGLALVPAAGLAQTPPSSPSSSPSPSPSPTPSAPASPAASATATATTSPSATMVPAQTPAVPTSTPPPIPPSPTPVALNVQVIPFTTTVPAEVTVHIRGYLSCAGHRVTATFSVGEGANAVTYGSGSIVVNAEGNGSIVVPIDGPDGMNVPVTLTSDCFAGGSVTPGGFAFVAIPYADPPWPAVPAGQGLILIPRFLLEQPSGRAGGESRGDFLQALDIYANGQRCGTLSVRLGDWTGDPYLILGAPGQPAACSQPGAEVCLQRGTPSYPLNMRWLIGRDLRVIVKDLAPAPPGTGQCDRDSYPAPPDAGSGTVHLDAAFFARTAWTVLGGALMVFGFATALIVARRHR